MYCSRQVRERGVDCANSWMRRNSTTLKLSTPRRKRSSCRRAFSRFLSDDQATPTRSTEPQGTTQIDFVTQERTDTHFTIDLSCPTSAHRPRNYPIVAYNPPKLYPTYLVSWPVMRSSKVRFSANTSPPSSLCLSLSFSRIDLIEFYLFMTVSKKICVGNAVLTA